MTGANGVRAVKCGWPFLPLCVSLCVVTAPPDARGAVADDLTSVPECCRPKTARAPEVGVVLFRAEGCAASAKVASAVSAAADGFTSAPVLFVTLDFSTPRQAEQSEFLAKGLGLDKLWSGFARQTGFALIVDWKTRKPVAKITAFDGTDLLVRHVREVLAASAGNGG